jgi:hypothetical protein
MSSTTDRQSLGKECWRQLTKQYIAYAIADASQSNLKTNTQIQTRETLQAEDAFVPFSLI